MTDEKELDALKARVAELEAKQPLDPRALQKEADEWRSQMHAMAERRASAGARSNFHPDDLREFARAVSPEECREIVRAGGVRGPSGAGASGELTKVSSNAGITGSNTGWQTPTPIGPPPGIRYVDAQLDAQDRRDRVQRIAEENRIKAEGKRK